MNILYFIFTFTFTAGAHASYTTTSYYQTKCSTADGSIKMNSGHVNNETTVTTRTSKSKQAPQISEMALDRSKIKVYVAVTTEIKKERYNSCNEYPNQTSGYATQDTYYTNEVIITNIDNTPFPKEIIPLSNDGFKIKGLLLCHNHFSGSIPCPKN